MVEAASPQQRLREGLSNARAAANDATMAASLIRPNRPAERVKEALAHLRAALTVATEAVGEALGAADRGDGMHRRGLLRALSTAAATAVLPPGSLHALTEVAQALGRSSRVDAGLLDRLDDVVSSLARRFYGSAPDELTGPVRGLADSLSRLLIDGSMEPGTRQRLAALSADTHLFAGWLALDSDLRADARAYFRMARDLAREAHDEVLHAAALQSDGVLYALRTPDGRRGDPQRAVWQLSQALGGLPADSPAEVRAWLAASGARHRAMTGDAYGFQAGMLLAEQAVERLRFGQTPTTRGFMSSEGWLSVVRHDNWLVDYEGRGLLGLGRHGQAVEVLTGVLDGEGSLRRRSSTLGSLAMAWAEHDPEQAAAAGIDSFDLAVRTSYAVQYTALDALRARLPDDVPGVAELDERLAAV